MSKAPAFFTFREVLLRAGYELTEPKANMAAGQQLRAYMLREHQVEPSRLMTDKTNPASSVAAQHVIAHYPMRYFAEAVRYFKSLEHEERRQMGMFE